MCQHKEPSHIGYGFKLLHTDSRNFVEDLFSSIGKIFSSVTKRVSISIYSKENNTMTINSWYSFFRNHLPNIAILNLLSGSLKLNFETMPTPGSLRSVMSSTCTSGLERPSVVGTLGHVAVGAGGFSATISFTGEGGGGSSEDVADDVREDDVSVVSLMVVRSFPARSGMNVSNPVLLLLLL